MKAGYNAAVKAKKDRESKSKAGTGGKGVRDRVGPAQEKGIWLTLIDHLQRQVRTTENASGGYIVWLSNLELGSVELGCAI